MTTTVKKPSSNQALNILINIWDWIQKIPPVYPIFIVVAIGVSQLNPNFATPNGIMAFVRRAAPLVILTMGQMFVLASGGFDLSQGSVVTLTIIGSALIIYNNEENTYLAIAIMLGLGVMIGLVNGFVVAYLKVPSLIATLGMLLLVRGGGLILVRGSAQRIFFRSISFYWQRFYRGYTANWPFPDVRCCPAWGRYYFGHPVS